MQKEKIFTFTDYRTFLRSHLQKKREDNPNWSLGVWTTKLGLSSKSTLAMIINGHRHPGNKLKKKLTEYFKFNKKELQYFSDLIKLQKSENDPRLSVLLMESMDRINPNGGFRLLEDKEFSAISNWYYYTIREMVHLEDFREDPKWIAKKLRFKLSQAEITKTIKDLLALNLLSRDENNDLIQTESAITSTSGITSEAIKRNHEQNMDHSKEAIRNIAVDDRYMAGVTLTIREENMDKARELLLQFQEKFIDLMEEKSGNSTVQLNLQLFPLTKSNNLKERNDHVLH